MRPLIWILLLSLVACATPPEEKVYRKPGAIGPYYGPTHVIPDGQGGYYVLGEGGR